jgi:nitrate reductase delta subunit
MKFRTRSSTATEPAPIVQSHAARSNPGVDQTRVLALVSLLLGYPDAELLGRLPLLDCAAQAVTGPAGRDLQQFVDHLKATPPDRLACEYVDTFDLRRRCCLYLTYYAHGDTRKRGSALVRFTHAYRSAGFPPPDGELPDHLAVVCSFAALAPEAGLELLSEHRAGVELLRMGLSEVGSPYINPVDALRSVLPEPAESDVAKALDQARRGPPAEEVGLEPFGPPEYMGR